MQVFGSGCVMFYVTTVPLFFSLHRVRGRKLRFSAPVKGSFCLHQPYLGIRPLSRHQLLFAILVVTQWWSDLPTPVRITEAGFFLYHAFDQYQLFKVPASLNHILTRCSTKPSFLIICIYHTCKSLISSCREQVRFSPHVTQESGVAFFSFLAPALPSLGERNSSRHRRKTLAEGQLSLAI